MSSIDLSDVNGGYNLVKINQNFTEIERVINEELLHRVNEDSSPNSLETDIDANSRRVYNLPTPTTGGEPLRLKDLFGAPDELLGGPEITYRTAIAGQTEFVPNGSYVPGSNSIYVYRNGVLQQLAVDYEESTPTLITFLTPMDEGDVITMSPVAVEIGSTGSNTTAVSLGNGSDIYKQKVGETLQFRSLVAGAGISLVEGANDITITSTGGSGSGEANTASNLGPGHPLFAGKSGVDLQFKTLIGANGITIGETPTALTIANNFNTTPYSGYNLGASGEGVYASTVGAEHQFKKIKAGSNVSLSSDASSITISSSATDQTTASNLGTGQGIFSSKVGGELQFKSLVAGNNITIASDSTGITINSTASGAGGVDIQKFASYGLLRAYSGTSTVCLITATGIKGLFYYDSSDALSTDNGGTVIVDSIGRRWKREFTGPVRASWFGAVGGGVDCTSSLTNAFNASRSVILEDVYTVSSQLTVSSGSFELVGTGPQQSGLAFTGNAGTICLLYNCIQGNNSQMRLANFGFFAKGAGATMVKVDCALTSAPTQVNGQEDKLVIENITMTGWLTGGYIGTGLHIKNTGGVHTKNFKIENYYTESSNSACRGVYLEKTDSRVYMIRSLNMTDTYMAFIHSPIVASSGTGGTIESVYLNQGELVHCYSAFTYTGNVQATSLVGLHVDTAKHVFYTAGAMANVIRMTGCDFRRGGYLNTTGSMFVFDYIVGLNMTGCVVIGNDDSQPNNTNICFSFVSTSGYGPTRGSITGNHFSNFAIVYGDTGGEPGNGNFIDNMVTSSNAYGSIRIKVYEQNIDSSLIKSDAQYSSQFIVTLDTSGNQLVYENIPSKVKFFDSAPMVVIASINSNHTGTVTVSYDYDASSSTQLAFRIKGNTSSPQLVRISYVVMGISFHTST